MKFIIVITMFMFNPNHIGQDAVVMLSQFNKPLIFDTVDDCREHVNLNLAALIKYANTLYKGEGVVKQILCIQDTSSGNDV